MKAEAPKCTRCSGDVLHGDLIVYQHGDFFHVRCWQVQQSREHILDSKQLAARSRDQLARSQEHLAQSRRTVADSLCIVCEKVIAPADRVNGAKGPAHRACAGTG